MTDPRAAVAATIETVLWAITDEDNLRSEFAQTAKDVRAMSQDDPCCALCEEVVCDDGCPLAEWRA